VGVRATRCAIALLAIIGTRLMMEGRRDGEPDQFLRAAAAVLVEPKVGHKHANHFHLRIFCARDDRPHCQDTPPYWPWFDGDRRFFGVFRERNPR
jgi:hypothetical protein